MCLLFYCIPIKLYISCFILYFEKNSLSISKEIKGEMDKITMNILYLHNAWRKCTYIELYKRLETKWLKSRRLWVEVVIAVDGGILHWMEVLIQTWYRKLDAGSLRIQQACRCVWCCWHPDADVWGVNSSGVLWTCRNSPSQTLWMIKNKW